MSAPYVVGVDLGGSHVHAAVVDLQGKVISESRADIDRTRPVDALLRDEIARTILEAIRQSRCDIRGVGMGLPGNIDRVNGVCRFSPNFGWRDVAVASPLQDAVGHPVFLLNDVRSHTLGELHFGAGKGFRSFAMLALGTGIGGGVVIDGRLVEGAHSAGGELGHMTVAPDGPPCGCGNHGCIEALASGPAIVRAAKERVASGGGPRILSEASTPDGITPALLAKLAEEGDADAFSIWQTAGRWLGIAVANVITSIDPEAILIGGGVGQAGELLLAPLREEVKRRCRMVAPGATPILPAALGENAGLIGAAALALESLGYLAAALSSSQAAGV